MQDHQHMTAPGEAEAFAAETALLVTATTRLRAARREHDRVTTAFRALTAGTATPDGLERARAAHKKLVEIEQQFAACVAELRGLIGAISRPAGAV